MEDVSSWTDNEDQEADGEDRERTGSAAVRGTVSEAALRWFSSEDMGDRLREECSAFLFILVSECSGNVWKGDAFHLRELKQETTGC